MSYKEKYERMNTAYHDNMRESYIESTKELIEAHFLDNPSAKRVRINNSPSLEWVWIVEDSKNPSVKRIVMPPEQELRPGWLVEWNDETWLCTSVDKSNRELYEFGFIERCNSDLKWIDDNGIIRSYPAVFYYGTKANFGNYSDRVMTMPDGRRQVTVSYNEHTIRINRKNRFIFGFNAFVVIDHDHISEAGVVHLNLKDDQLNPSRDNVELGIADYYRHKDDEEPSGNDLSIQIVSSSDKPDEIRINQMKDYQAKIYSKDTLIEEEVVFELYAEDMVSPTALAYIEEQGDNNCTIRNNNSSRGYVQLRCFLQSNPDVETWLKIQLRNLF